MSVKNENTVDAESITLERSAGGSMRRFLKKSAFVLCQN